MRTHPVVAGFAWHRFYWAIHTGLNTAIMLQIINADADVLSRHIDELKVYLDKLIREKHSPVKIQKHRYHIEQLQLLLKAKSGAASTSPTG